MQDFSAYDESATKAGFWGVLARKAKAILDEDGEFLQDDMLGGVSSQSSNASTGTQVNSNLIFVCNIEMGFLQVSDFLQQHIQISFHAQITFDWNFLSYVV